jgi:F-type H+-transporting ATPase subunit a
VSEKKKRRFGFKRWIVILMILLGIYCAYFGATYLKPISPTVVLSPEPIAKGSCILNNNFCITNTMLGTILADIVLILLGIATYRFAKSGKLIPGGIYNAFEALVEYLYNTVEGATGKWVRRIVPLVLTIFLLIFVANMIKLVPGFESIGYLEQAHKGYGYGTVELFSIGSLPVYTLDAGKRIDVAAYERALADSTGETEAQAEESEAHTEELCTVCHVIPFLRGSATDLNFTFALAVIAVLMTQVYGVWALGPGYFNKFLPFKRLFSGGPFGAIDFVVGLLELVLEFAKILSFSFRLFGNVFAGALLLAIIGALLPVILPPGLYFFEIFFGVIQAYVFFLLATMFISMALVSHHDESHSESHA